MEQIWDTTLDMWIGISLSVFLAVSLLLNITAHSYQCQQLNSDGFSATIFFYCVLTVTDMLTAAFSIPVMIVTLLRDRSWDSQKTLYGQLLCGVTGFVHNFTSRASLYIILIMAGGRIFAMNRPFQYRHVFNKRNSIIMVAVACIIPIILSLLPFFRGRPYIYSNYDSMCVYKIDDIFSAEDRLTLRQWVLPYFLLVILPTTIPGILIICLLCITIIKMFLIHREKHRMRFNLSKQTQRMDRIPLITKATKTLLILISSFSVTYVWWWILSSWTLLELLGVTKKGLFNLVSNNTTQLYLLQMTVLNVYISCVTDPLIYILLGFNNNKKATQTKQSGTMDFRRKTGITMTAISKHES